MEADGCPSRSCVAPWLSPSPPPLRRHPLSPFWRGGRGGRAISGHARKTLTGTPPPDCSRGVVVEPRHRRAASWPTYQVNSHTPRDTRDDGIQSYDPPTPPIEDTNHHEGSCKPRNEC